MNLFYEPRLIFKNGTLNSNITPEMSEFESAFLCGLIREKKPKRILELGVSAGGTTAIILECLRIEEMEESCEVISVDLNERYYRDNSLKTGFLADQYKQKVTDRFNHSEKYGSYFPIALNQIDGKFDFAINDTVHALPGEMLDYPVVASVLTDKCTVVLHDTGYCAYRLGKGLSNTVLLGTASGRKIIPIGEDCSKMSALPNIGAWEIDNIESEKKNMINVFHAMSLTWEYMPSDEELSIYRDYYAKHYSKSELDCFDAVVMMQKINAENKIEKSFAKRIRKSARLMIKGY